jgi:hypothetical protein
LGTLLDNQIYTYEEIKSRLKSGNAGYISVQNLSFSSLLSKNVKIKIYRTVILPVVLDGCKIWSLTLREKRSVRVLGNRTLMCLRGEWRRLYDREQFGAIIWDVKSSRIRWARHVARMGEKRCACWILMRQPEK